MADKMKPRIKEHIMKPRIKEDIVHQIRDAKSFLDKLKNDDKLANDVFFYAQVGALHSITKEIECARLWGIPLTDNEKKGLNHDR